MESIKSSIKKLEQLYELELEHHLELFSGVSDLTSTELKELEKDFGYDMRQNFNIATIQYKIRECKDRLYTISLKLNNIKLEEDECEHDIVTDLIDIDPDRSMTIKYCTKCEKTFHK